MENIFHRLHCLHFLYFDESWTESGVFQSPVISISIFLCISCNFCSVKVLVCGLLQRWLESHLLRLIQYQEPEFYLVIDKIAALAFFLFTFAWCIFPVHLFLGFLNQCSRCMSFIELDFVL